MRSKSMQALTDDIEHDHPGIVIYGIGDAAHKLHPSGHNEDDTPGSLPEMQDADTKPEHRAIDAMLGSAFTKAEAYALIAYILARPDLLKRLIYIIFDGWIWSKSHGWVKRAFDGDPHGDHIHFSGDAADDDNTDPWLTGGDDMFCKYGDRGEAVKRLQLALLRLDSKALTSADGVYGDATATAVKRMLGGDGRYYGGELDLRLTEKLVKLWSPALPGPAGPAGPAGPQGPAGEPGKDGVVPDGATFVMQAPGGGA